MRKLLYIANIRLPTEKAHGIQVMEMCAAFAARGMDVSLVIPRRKNNIDQDIFSYYGIPETFRIIRLPTWDLVRFGRVGFLVQSFTFSISALLWAGAGKGYSIIYARDSVPLFFFSFLGKPYIFEAHAPSWHAVTGRVMRRALMNIVITAGLRNFFIRKGIAPEKLAVLPDGVDPARFAITESKEKCRARLSLPKEERIILYAGHLYPRKGAHILADAAKELQNADFYFVGGTNKDIPAFKKKYGDISNIYILGHKPRSDMPYFLKAADCLVLPNSGQNEDSRLYTSPMKLFEYMASGTPIVASRVPALQEILDEETAFFAKPDDPESLAHAICDALQSMEEAERRGRNARKRAEEFTWEKRAERIMNKIFD
ncbi:glycosyltransferase family 4 protein [bacterium]|nr:glycosyltransferase family 4 protein [bacterium]